MTVAAVLGTGLALTSPGLTNDVAAAPANAPAGPKVSFFKLANGMEVVVIPDRRAAVVTHMVWYRVGSADEPAGKSGIAHFLEHLMFKGTNKNPAGLFSKVVAEIGGQENAFTSTDYTAYFQRTAKERLATLMEFEADRMTGLTLTEADVLPERDVVLEERRMRVDSDPASQLSETLAATLFLNHPYGIPVIGWKHEIEKLNREDALAFYRRFYTPNNAILVIAGDIVPEEIKDLAERTYGRIAQTAPTPQRIRPLEPEPRAARKVTLEDERVRQPSLSRAYLAPSYTTAKPGEAEAIEVLAQALGAQGVGVLHRKLVIDRKIAVSAGAWYQGTALDDSRIGIYATPREGVTLDELEAALDEVLRETAKDGVPSDLIARARKRLVADAIYEQDSQSTLARVYGAALATGRTVEDVQNWPQAIEKVTDAEVATSAQAYLDKRRSATGLLAPARRM